MNSTNKHDLHLIGATGMVCCRCGLTLRPQELASVCPDCGAIFCVACTISGAMNNHICNNNKCEDD